MPRFDRENNILSLSNSGNGSSIMSFDKELWSQKKKLLEVAK